MRKDGWIYWTTGLPDESDALQDLQKLAEELGVTRAEANRLLLVAYSKAIRGEWGRLWGFSMELQSESSITTQKRLVKELFDKKGWKLAGWREEPERSANNNIDDLIEERPVFAQLLDDAEARQFQVVVCAFSNRWARSMEVGYASLTRLRRARVWWYTADGLWDIEKVQQDGFNVAFAVDMSMNEAYVRQLSKRTIAGKEDRAREDSWRTRSI